MFSTYYEDSSLNDSTVCFKESFDLSFLNKSLEELIDFYCTDRC